MSERIVEHRVARRVGELGEYDRVLVGQRGGPAAVDRNRDCGCHEDSGADRQPTRATLREHGPLSRGCVRLKARRLTIALQTLEVRADLAGVLVATLSFLFQAAFNDAFQFVRQPGIQVSQRRRRAIQNAVEDQPRAVAVKRWRTSRHFVQHHAEREQVGAGIQVLCPYLLGRHVGDRSQRTAWTCQAGDRRYGRRGVVSVATRTDFGQAEVENLGVAAAGAEQIRRLDVAVNDPGVMRRLERVGDLDRHCQQQVDIERVPGHAVLQGRPFEAFHHQERAAVLFADVVDGADVGVIQGGSGLRLVAESGQGIGSVSEIGRQELQRDKAPQPRILGLVYDAHSAAAQLLGDPIVRERLTDQRIAAGTAAVAAALSGELACGKIECGSAEKAVGTVVGGEQRADFVLPWLVAGAGAPRR